MSIPDSEREEEIVEEPLEEASSVPTMGNQAERRSVLRHPRDQDAEGSLETSQTTFPSGGQSSESQSPLSESDFTFIGPFGKKQRMIRHGAVGAQKDDSSGSEHSSDVHEITAGSSRTTGRTPGHGGQGPQRVSVLVPSYIIPTISISSPPPSPVVRSAPATPGRRGTSSGSPTSPGMMLSHSRSYPLSPEAPSGRFTPPTPPRLITPPTPPGQFNPQQRPFLDAPGQNLPLGGQFTGHSGQSILKLSQFTPPSPSRQFGSQGFFSEYTPPTSTGHFTPPSEQFTPPTPSRQFTPPTPTRRPLPVTPRPLRLPVEPAEPLNLTIQGSQSDPRAHHECHGHHHGEHHGHHHGHHHHGHHHHGHHHHEEQPAHSFHQANVNLDFTHTLASSRMVGTVQPLSYLFPGVYHPSPPASSHPSSSTSRGSHGSPKAPGRGRSQERKGKKQPPSATYTPGSSQNPSTSETSTQRRPGRPRNDSYYTQGSQRMDTNRSGKPEEGGSGCNMRCSGSPAAKRDYTSGGSVAAGGVGVQGPVALVLPQVRGTRKHGGTSPTGKKKYQCPDCKKEFSQLRNFRYHRSRHEGTKQFACTCPVCGKSFNDKGYLSSHLKIHRNAKEYKCEWCEKSFNQRVAYNMHIRIHTGLKPHQCHMCNKAFSRKMLLRQHLRTHTGERPYHCVVCGKSFADRSNMLLHQRLHTGDRPYKCDQCNKTFSKNHHLKTHMNHHLGIRPYHCPKCSACFSQSSNMKTHLKKCTGVKPQNSSGPSTSRSAGVGSSPRQQHGNGTGTPTPRRRTAPTATVTTDGQTGTPSSQSSESIPRSIMYGAPTQQITTSTAYFSTAVVSHISPDMTPPHINGNGLPYSEYTSTHSAQAQAQARRFQPSRPAPPMRHHHSSPEGFGNHQAGPPNQSPPQPYAYGHVTGRGGLAENGRYGLPPHSSATMTSGQILFQQQILQQNPLLQQALIRPIPIPNYALMGPPGHPYQHAYPQLRQPHNIQMHSVQSERVERSQQQQHQQQQQLQQQQQQQLQRQRQQQRPPDTPPNQPPYPPPK